MIGLTHLRAKPRSDTKNKNVLNLHCGTNALINNCSGKATNNDFEPNLSACIKEKLYREQALPCFLITFMTTNGHPRDCDREYISHRRSHVSLLTVKEYPIP